MSICHTRWSSWRRGVPVWLVLKRRLSETTQGMAHHAVFMVNVQLPAASRGSRGDTSVSHRPIPLSRHRTDRKDRQVGQAGQDRQIY